MLKEFWKRIGPRGRVGLVAGLTVIMGLTALVAWWALRPRWEVLFADLTAQDAGAMTAELDRLKVPYVLSGEDGRDGTTILVDQADVHGTRLKLMGRDLPLHGAVGFELFNNSDFGMTEFAQKVNYQRALQGELTRTILSLSEIRDARVLLAMPEQGLFRQTKARPKASITLALRQGQSLRPEQVVGIQRLVAAAVPGIATEDVTLVDQWGVALTRAAGETPGEGGTSRLDLKREAETYLSRKAGEVLERALGPGQALASVDVTLDLDRVQKTTEEIVGSPGDSARGQAGVLVREREVVREMGSPLAVRTDAGGTGSSSQREVEYAVGRRVEQVIGQPGTIRRLHVVAVVRQALSPSQEQQVSRLVAASVGASPERGDTVVVQSVEAMRAPPVASATLPAGEGRGVAGTASVLDAGVPQRRAIPSPRALFAGALILALGVVLAVAWVGRRRAEVTTRAGTPAPLSGAEREAALVQLRSWLRSGDARRAPGDAA